MSSFVNWKFIQFANWKQNSFVQNVMLYKWFCAVNSNIKLKLSKSKIPWQINWIAHFSLVLTTLYSHQLSIKVMWCDLFKYHFVSNMIFFYKIWNQFKANNYNYSITFVLVHDISYMKNVIGGMKWVQNMATIENEMNLHCNFI